MSTKSDRQAQVKPSEVIYSDFTTNFRVHPQTGQLIVLKNDKSITQSLKNLILTDLGEGLYQPLKGGNVKAQLFEPVSGFSANDLKDQIKLTIFNNEPRVESLNVIVTPEADQNAYRVTVEYRQKNQVDAERFELVLVRTR